MYLDSNNTWRMACGCTEANALDGNHNVCRNKDDVNLPRCETVGIAGIAAGIAGLLTAQKAINSLLNFLQIHFYLNHNLLQVVLKL